MIQHIKVCTIQDHIQDHWQTDFATIKGLGTQAY